MKYKQLYFLILFFSSAFLFSCSQTEKIKKGQKSFIPEVVSNLYIGMPLSDFKEARGIRNLSVVEGKIITIAKEEYVKDSVSLLQYQFAGDKKLYEIIVEYVPECDAKARFKLKYGEPNNGKEWLFVISKKLKLKIWIYQNRLCIADSKQFNY